MCCVRVCDNDVPVLLLAIHKSNAAGGVNIVTRADTQKRADSDGNIVVVSKLSKHAPVVYDYPTGSHRRSLGRVTSVCVAAEITPGSKHIVTRESLVMIVTVFAGPGVHWRG